MAARRRPDKAALNALIPVGHDAYGARATLRRPGRQRAVAALGCSTLPATWFEPLRGKAKPGDTVQVAIKGSKTVERYLLLGEGARLTADAYEPGKAPVTGYFHERQIPAKLRAGILV